MERSIKKIESLERINYILLGEKWKKLKKNSFSVFFLSLLIYSFILFYLFGKIFSNL